MSKSDEYEMITSSGYTVLNTNEDYERMDRIYKFIMGNIDKKIRLKDVAEVAYLSSPSFCRYFKSRTNKSFSFFLNEIRIGHACRLLIETNKDSAEICFASGFNSLSNFHKQFQKVKNTTPSAYRSEHQRKV
jgi:AraC-like DNA-binding protein